MSSSSTDPSQRSAALLLPVLGSSHADTQILCSTAPLGPFATKRHGMPSAFQELFHLEHPQGSSKRCMGRALQPGSLRGASGRCPAAHTNLDRAERLLRPAKSWRHFQQQQQLRQAGARAVRTLFQPLPGMSTPCLSEPASRLRKRFCWGRSSPRGKHPLLKSLQSAAMAQKTPPVIFLILFHLIQFHHDKDPIYLC